MPGVEAQTDIQFLSVVSIGELRRGATLLVQGSARRLQLEHYIEIKIPLLFGKRVLPVTQAIAEWWGVLDARRQAAGQPLGIADGMIAATAIEHGLTLVTRNVKDFVGLGLTIFNPWDLPQTVAPRESRRGECDRLIRAVKMGASFPSGRPHNTAGVPLCYSAGHAFLFRHSTLRFGKVRQTI